VVVVLIDDVTDQPEEVEVFSEASSARKEQVNRAPFSGGA